MPLWNLDFMKMKTIGVFIQYAGGLNGNGEIKIFWKMAGIKQNLPFRAGYKSTKFYNSLVVVYRNTNSVEYCLIKIKQMMVMK